MVDRVPFEAGELVVHRSSEQRMRIERRVPSMFSGGVDAYWCRWRSLVGRERRAMFSGDALDRIPNPDAERSLAKSDDTSPAPFGYERGVAGIDFTGDTEP
jgi:hypothetical protein